MKFTIGTVSSFQKYEKDLNLIKSSLLYADEIELIGLTEYVVFKYLPSILDSTQDFDAFLNGMILFFKSINIPNKEEFIHQMEDVKNQIGSISPIIKKKRMRTPAELQAQMKMNRLRKELKEQLNAVSEQFVNEPTSQELQMLVNNKIVSVFDYKLQGMNTEEMSGSYVGNMLNAIHNPNTFPLFDSTSTDFIGSIAKIKLIDISKLDAEILRHAGVATNILMTLPTLSGATYDELLDLKKQNAVPLAKFRMAIYGFSEKIASLPWDNNFQYECIKIYDTEVVPKVAEINELFTETSVLKNLGKKVFADEEIRKNAGFAAGGLATAITTASSFSGWIRNLLLTMSIATLSKEAAIGLWKVINLGIQTHDEIKEVKKIGKENVMYYYYLATKL